jgi:hypothetical protein
MPITDVVILALIVFAFVAFAVVLAWGDRQTHEIAKASRARALAGTHAAAPEPKAKVEAPIRKVEAKKPERTPVHA